MKTMSSRHRKLLVCIWNAWKDGRVVSVRTLVAEARYQSTGGVFTALRSLVEKGWLVADETYSRGQPRHKYLPGPLFAGLDSDGTPLKLITDDEAIQQEATRIAKYDRRSVLFEVAS